MSFNNKLYIQSHVIAENAIKQFVANIDFDNSNFTMNIGLYAQVVESVYSKVFDQVKTQVKDKFQFKSY